MDYRESCRRILELSAHKNPVDTLREFYEWLGCPGSGGEIIHVAGTNGKGSVCAFLDSVLSGAGYRVGVFTSPHLVTLRERFRLCGKGLTRGHSRGFMRDCRKSCAASTGHRAEMAQALCS